MKKFSIIGVIGRSGSGKGTQVQLLHQKTGFEIVRTGDLLRERARKKDIVGTVVAKALNSGNLIPTPIVFSLWMPRLEEIKNKATAKGIIFDGNPRKLYEAQMLEEVFAFFGWDKRFRACYIHVTEKEIKLRLMARGRGDDTPRSIRERLSYFLKEVKPTIDYYKKKKVLIQIDGDQSIEKIHSEIMKKLKSFLK